MLADAQPPTNTTAPTVAQDPYSSKSGELLGRDEIQRMNEQIVAKTGAYCLHGGKMQVVYKDISLEDSTISQYDQRYICIWPFNYNGMRCEEWAKGYFGQHWHPWPKHPISNIVCGVGNIWDDGLLGKGKWYCKDNSMDPQAFWETKLNSDHNKNEEVITFGFFLLIIVGFFVTILLYIYNKIHSLEVFPESIASIILGIVVGLFFKSHYKNTGLLKILEFEPHTFFLFLNWNLKIK